MKYNVTIQWKTKVQRRNQSATVTIEADPTHDKAALALEKLNRERRQRRLETVYSSQVWETDIRIA